MFGGGEDIGGREEGWMIKEKKGKTDLRSYITDCIFYYKRDEVEGTDGGREGRKE